MDSAILRNLNATATALAQAVERANARMNGRRHADSDQLVLLCIDLQRTFESLASAVAIGDPDHQAVVEACEIYRLVVRRLVSSAGFPYGEGSPDDRPVTRAPAAHARLRHTQTARAGFGRHARGRQAVAVARRLRPSGRARTLRVGGAGSPHAARTTRRCGDAHSELIAMAARAVRDSRLRLDAIESAARDTREAARRTAARVQETARILEIVSVALYRAG